MKITLVSLLLFSAICISVVAQDQGDSATVSKIVALEKAWNQAFKLRDTKALDTLLDESLVLVNDDGSLQSKSLFIAGIRASKPSEEEQVTPESISVHVFGNVAIATGIFRAKGVEAGKPYLRRDRFVRCLGGEKRLVDLRIGFSYSCASLSFAHLPTSVSPSSIPAA